MAPHPATRVQPTPGARLASNLLPACQALFMSALVTLVAVAVNASPGAALIGAFGRAWALTLPVAIVAAYLTKPLSSRLAALLAALLHRQARPAPNDPGDTP